MLEDIGALLGFVQSDVAVAAFLFAATAALVALCVPGGIVTMAASAAALLDGWTAVPLVSLGALAGSQALFLAIRRAGAEPVRARLGERLPAFERAFARHGAWYVLALRLTGAPHFLVTAGSAVLPVRAGAFAAATLVGLLPSIALIAAAGSLL